MTTSTLVSGRDDLEVCSVPCALGGEGVVFGLALVFVAERRLTDDEDFGAGPGREVGTEQLVFAGGAVADVNGSAAAAAAQDGITLGAAEVFELGVGVRVNGGGEVDVAAVGVDDDGLHGPPSLRSRRLQLS